MADSKAENNNPESIPEFEQGAAKIKETFGLTNIRPLDAVSTETFYVELYGKEGYNFMISVPRSLDAEEYMGQMTKEQLNLLKAHPMPKAFGIAFLSDNSLKGNGTLSNGITALLRFGFRQAVIFPEGKAGAAKGVINTLFGRAVGVFENVTEGIKWVSDQIAQIKTQ